MATFDQLSAEQRAILELVLKQGQSYEDLSEMLNMPTSRVRELGRNALVRLSPVSAAAVDDDWRDQLGDYLLNQQAGPDSTATRGHLRRSEESRAWARSVLDSLEQFYDEDNLPEIPSGDGAAEPRRPRRRARTVPAADDEGAEPEPKPRRPARPLSPEARRIMRNRRLAGGAALAAAVLFAILVWPFSVLGGDDDDDGGGSADNRRAGRQDARIEGQISLSPVRGSSGGTSGLAVIARQRGRRTLIVQAQLRPLPDRQAYEVWLYNSPGQARSLGAQVTDRAGAFQGAGALPDDFRRYRFIDISREPLTADNKHSGDSVLRGRLSAIQPPPSGAAGDSR